MATDKRIKEKGYAIAIGDPKQDQPYFMLSDDSLGPRIFDNAEEAQKHTPKDCKVVKVIINEI